MQAQTEIFFGNDEKIKSEKNYWGVKRGKDWAIPAQYDKIEGFGGLSEMKDGKMYHTSLGGGVIVCHKGDVMDIYEISYGQNLIVGGITAEQFEILKLYPFYNTKLKLPAIRDKKWSGAIDMPTAAQKKVFESVAKNIYPYIKNNKWGFATEYNDVAPLKFVLNAPAPPMTAAN